MLNQRRTNLFPMQNTIFICLFDRNKLAFWLKSKKMRCVASPPKSEWTINWQSHKPQTIKIYATIRIYVNDPNICMLLSFMKWQLLQRVTSFEIPIPNIIHFDRYFYISFTQKVILFFFSFFSIRLHWNRWPFYFHSHWNSVQHSLFIHSFIVIAGLSLN